MTPGFARPIKVLLAARYYKSWQLLDKTPLRYSTQDYAARVPNSAGDIDSYVCPSRDIPTTIMLAKGCARVRDYHLAKDKQYSYSNRINSIVKQVAQRQYRCDSR